MSETLVLSQGKPLILTQNSLTRPREAPPPPRPPEELVKLLLDFTDAGGDHILTVFYCFCSTLATHDDGDGGGGAADGHPHLKTLQHPRHA